MKRSPDVANAVITANAFNPSVFRESFLQKLGILDSDEAVQPGFVFSDQFVNVPTAHFNLLVLPQQLQLTPVAPSDGAALVSSILGGIVKALPHTPFTAIGLNFVWSLDTEGETVAAATRRLFSSRGALFRDFAEAPDAKFGYFVSRDLGERKPFGVVRLKADFKPVLDTRPGTIGNERILCSFNYNIDLVAEAAQEAVAELSSRWLEFNTLSEKLTEELMSGQASS